MYDIHVNDIISMARSDIWLIISKHSLQVLPGDNLTIVQKFKWIFIVKMTINDQSSIWHESAIFSQTSILSVWIWTLHDQLTVNFPKQTTNALRIFDMGTYVDARFAAS